MDEKRTPNNNNRPTGTRPPGTANSNGARPGTGAVDNGAKAASGRPLRAVPTGNAAPTRPTSAAVDGRTPARPASAARNSAASARPPQRNRSGAVPPGVGYQELHSNPEFEDGQTIVVPKVREKDTESESGNVTIFMRGEAYRSLGSQILWTTLKLSVVGILVVAMIFAGALAGVAKGYVDMAPTLDTNKILQQAQGSSIFDGNGELITTYTGLEDRIYVTLDQIPKQLQDAFTSIEDIRFYKHSGVDLKRMVSAVFGNMSNTNTHGGSTITQQLVRNRLLTLERTYKRKIQEAEMSVMLETLFTKEQILEAYMNTILLGDSNYGVKTAAADYFGKTDLNTLTLRECACLAGLTQNPSSYNPRKNFYVRNTPERTNDRTDTVLNAMHRAGVITQEQLDEALNDQLDVKEAPEKKQIYDYPHFVEYAISDVIKHFMSERGMEDTRQNRSDIENEIRTGGYKIYLTIDPQIQETVQESLHSFNGYPTVADSTKRKKVYDEPDGSTYTVPQPQAAAVVYDYHHGTIKAIVGSRDTPDRLKSLNRATANLPVGSSIKPLTVYGPALDKGLTPNSTVLNVDEPIEGWPGGRPDNYDGGSFTGPVTLRSALVNSYNVPAARIMMETVTVNDAKTYLISLGVDPSHVKDPTPAGMALGASGLSAVEMAVGFGAIANSGQYIEAVSFSKVLDSNGNVLLAPLETQKKMQVYKQSSAYDLVSMLTDAVRNGTGKSARINGMTVAGKTGTNEGKRGVYFAGMTPYYSASVWIGHDDFKYGFSRGTGGKFAAPLWKNFMEKIHRDKGLPDKKIISDDAGSTYGMEQYKICSDTGMLATQYCTNTSTSFFTPEGKPGYCSKHSGPTTIAICADSGMVAGPNCPDSSKQQQVGYPASGKAVCTLHNEAWNESPANHAVLIEKANSAISAANKRLSTLGDGVPSAVRAQIQSKITALKAAMQGSASNKELSDAISRFNADVNALLASKSPAPNASPISTPKATPTPTKTNKPATPTPTKSKKPQPTKNQR